MVEVYVHTERSQFSLAIKKGARLLPRVGSAPYLVWRLLVSIGIAYRGMGEISTGEAYFQRALEMSELMGDKKVISWVKFQIYVTKYFRAEYVQAYKGFLSYQKDPYAWKPHRADYYKGAYALITGQTEEALKLLDSFLENEEEGPFWLGGLELRGLTLRILGKFSEAMENFLESAEGYIGYDAAYAAFPVAKALELARLARLQLPPKDLIRKSIALAKEGSWGEQAAAQEAEALLMEDDSDAAEGLCESAESYMKACQNMEALFSGFTAAFLAWKTTSNVFLRAINLLAPIIPLYPGFKKDPLLGNYLSGVEILLKEISGPNEERRRIRAFLIGECKVLIDGKEIPLEKWHNNKAIRAFIYFLLSPSHRIAHDHLFYLLWPRRSYNKRSRFLLYTAIDTIRKHLGRRELLTKEHDFYQLEDVWTDLGELENLMRLADAVRDPAERKEYLVKARNLAEGDLLPEFLYDKHIDEYRYYYNRLRNRLLQEDVML